MIALPIIPKILSVILVFTVMLILIIQPRDISISSNVIPWGYVQVTWDLILELKKEVGIDLIAEYEVRFDENTPPDCTLECTEEELFCLYEELADNDYFEENLAIKDMLKVVKRVKTPSSDKLKHVLLKYAKELRSERQEDIERTKKFHLYKMERLGMR